MNWNDGGSLYLSLASYSLRCWRMVENDKLIGFDLIQTLYCFGIDNHAPVFDHLTDHIVFYGRCYYY